jgi:hypothetical protein
MLANDVLYCKPLTFRTLAAVKVHFINELTRLPLF